MFAPTEEGIAVCPPALKTASPSLIALPVIFTAPQNSSTASTENETVIFFIELTLVGTVKELLIVAAPSAESAWKVPAVVVLCVTLLVIASAIVSAPQF
tara:strand:- start:80 stop:376 length:297 start_codon:yes stop_codon:yes gene_type:complete